LDEPCRAPPGVVRASRSDGSARRNQCDLLIGYHLAPSNRSELNGEHWLLDAVAPSVERCMDVGANVGDSTAALLARNPTARGIAVEPGVEALRRLGARVSESVTVVAAAAGSKEGMTSFDGGGAVIDHRRLGSRRRTPHSSSSSTTGSGERAARRWAGCCDR